MVKSPSFIYLDHAASTPVDIRVLQAMEPYWQGCFANAGSLHQEGRRAKEAITNARLKVAQVLSVTSESVIFTSGGTESNNLAIFGTLRGLHEQGIRYEDMHAITSVLEHASVSDCFAELSHCGVQTSEVKVSNDGRIDIDHFQELLTPKTRLVSLLLVSNEIGVIEPIREIATIIKAYEVAHNTQIYFHVDASQGVVYLPTRLDTLGADLLTIDAQKMYGPKGVGALAATPRVPLRPIMFGGSQERGLRPGTPNTPLVVGLGEAITIANNERAEVSERVQALRDEFINGVLMRIPAAVLNGSRFDRVANNANFSFPNIDGERLVVELDRRNIAASTRSACLAGVAPGSKVVRALGRGGDSATSSVRFTLGKTITKSEISQAIACIADAVECITAL